MIFNPPVVSGSLAETLLAHFFSRSNGEFAVGGIPLRQLVEIYGSPLYVYDADLMRRNYCQLQQAVNGFAKVYFSIKANPNPAVANVFVKEGAGLEVASGGEFLLAKAAGCAPEHILFAGPGKGAEELDLAIHMGIGQIHLESFEEITCVAMIAARLNRKVSVAIRINPGADAQGGAMRMGGYPAAFGFDEEILDDVLAALAAHTLLDFSGVHLFTGTQILDAQVLLSQWAHALDVCLKVAQRTRRSLCTIDLGGGFGIPYYNGDASLDLQAIAKGIPALMQRVNGNPLLRNANIILEPGRYLTGNAGVYVMSVRAVKISRGIRFIITDGGMHHHLAASGNLGQVIKRDYPIVPVTNLDATRKGAIIAGPLCTPLDTLGRASEMPDMKAGDLIAVLQSGAYGLTASPVFFLGHRMPAEILVNSGQHSIIRQRGTFETPATTAPPCCTAFSENY